jgi:hypothetical protein
MARKSPVSALPVAENLKALRGALEHSVTIQQARLHQVVDDLVARGSLTRTEADRLVGQLITSSKGYTSALLAVLDAVATETRAVISGGLERGIGAGVAPVMATAGKIADTVRSTPRLVAAMAPARTTTKVPSASAAPSAESQAVADAATDNPIPGLAGMTVAEIRPRLSGLSATELERVRSAERAGKARKTLLAEIDRRLR